MPVSFAVLECESEGLKSPCAGGGSCPQRITRWWHSLPALPLPSGRGPTHGGDRNFSNPAAQNRGAGTKECAPKDEARNRIVIPAKAGIQGQVALRMPLWTPAFAGVMVDVVEHRMLPIPPSKGDPCQIPMT